MAQCECKKSCYHHKEKACPLEAETLPTEWLIDEKYTEGKPYPLKYCLMCLLNQEQRPQAAMKKP